MSSVNDYGAEKPCFAKHRVRSLNYTASEDYPFLFFVFSKQRR